MQNFSSFHIARLRKQRAREQSRVERRARRSKDGRKKRRVQRTQRNEFFDNSRAALREKFEQFFPVLAQRQNFVYLAVFYLGIFGGKRGKVRAEKRLVAARNAPRRMFGVDRLNRGRDRIELGGRLRGENRRRKLCAVKEHARQVYRRSRSRTRRHHGGFVRRNEMRGNCGGGNQHCKPEQKPQKRCRYVCKCAHSNCSLP